MVDSTKSFNNAAMFTLLLYMFLWIPGFVANIVYLNEARSIQKRTGRGPEGKGCLVALLIVMGGLVGGSLVVGSLAWAFLIVGLST